MDSVANPSQRFQESLRSIYTLSSIDQKLVNQKSTKIEEQWAVLPILLRDYKNIRECFVCNASNLKYVII
jgi:hypothetical protein